ncbi:MAG: glycosyltransferase family 4 protein [Chitinophagales bacterium]|nr:glycosyltransferase family 4 protein [Chitinophagales bacterium]
MRIGFDAKRAFHNLAGLGNYSRSIIKGIGKYYPGTERVLFTPFMKEALHLKDENAQIITGRGSLWRSFGIKNDIAESSVDMFHGLSNELPFGIDKIKIPSIVTIHDVLFKRYPRLYPWFDRQVYSYKTARACKEADKIIVISEQTRKDLITHFDVDHRKIELKYQSCGENFQRPMSDSELENVKAKYHLPERYLLTVGSLEERKNQSVLIKAIHLMKDKPDLTIIGRGSLHKKLLAQAAKYGLEDKVRIIENVDAADLPAIYRNASVFAYPSIFEGFGIPILEAIFSEVPVIVGRNSCFPEVAGPSSLYVDQSSAAEIASAIESVIDFPEMKKNITESSLKFAEKFRTEKVIQNLYSLYESL